MRHFSDLGAAVIGSGFIGTVHIEALRRLGVRVRGLLGSECRARRGRRPTRIGVPRAYPSLEALLEDPAVDVVHVTSPNQLHYPQVKAILARRPARRLREAAGGDLGGIGGARPARGGVRPHHGGQLQHPLLPAQPARTPDGRATARSVSRAWSPVTTSRTGCCATPTGTGAWSPTRAAACARSATSARTGSTSRASSAGCASRRSWPTSRRSSRSASSPPARSRRSPRSVASETVATPMSTEDAALILLRYDDGARGSVAISQVSAGRKNSLQWEVDGSDSGGLVGLRDARPPLPRPSRTAQRDPAARRRAHEPRRHRRDEPCRAATSRASRTRSMRSSERSTRRCSPAGRPSTPATPRSRTATTRCSSATPSRPAPARVAGWTCALTNVVSSAHDMRRRT